MLPKINPENTTAWKALNEHFANNDFELRTLFQYNPKRFNQFSVKRENYLFDFLKI
jgi:glucose-6-phosphate isomerase